MTKPNWNSIIVDNEPSDSNLLKSMLQEHCPQIAVLAQVSEVAEAIACIQNLEVNLVFCNVLLHDGDAFEMIDQLTDFQGYLIFLSVNEGLVLRAFRYNAFDYLLKPISVPVLIEAIGRLETRSSHAYLKFEKPEAASQKKKNSTIILNAVGMQHVVHVADIIHLEGDGNYSTVHLAAGDKILVSKPLKYFEEILPAKYFYRVHQSHIVNSLNVKSVQNGDVQFINLNNGNTAPLARRKKDTFLAWLAQH